MKLDAYLTLAKIRKSQFAKQLGVSAGTITGYCNGSLWPRRDVIERIIAATGGAVTADDFLTTPKADLPRADTSNPPF